VRQALPDATASDGLRLVRDITAGHLGDVTLAGHNAGEIQALAAVSFAGGYQWLFLAAALFMLVSTLLTWRLVSAAETPPVSVSAEAPSRQVLRLLQPSRDHHPAHVKSQTCENLAANEGEMPTYTVTTANLTLTPAQESAIAAAIHRRSHGNTGAPVCFAQVLFVALPERKHYIGGKLNKYPTYFRSRPDPRRTERRCQGGIDQGDHVERTRGFRRRRRRHLGLRAGVFHPNRWSSLDACCRSPEPRHDGGKD